MISFNLTIAGCLIQCFECSSKFLEEKSGEKDTIGYYEPALFRVWFVENLSPVMRDRTIKHELTHAVLDITGVANILTAEAEEAICDAMANFPGSFGDVYVSKDSSQS